MQVITTEKKPIKMWLDEIEDGALSQAKNLANLPFIHEHVALMPDCHQGYGMPIGGVIATKDVIIPNAVGVDIGCGMCAVETSLREIDIDTLKKIIGEIRDVIPIGFNKHKNPQNIFDMPKLNSEETCGNVTMEMAYEPNYWSLPIVYKEFDNAKLSIGSLGSGNHFIEIQKDKQGYIWIMIHSGSRNLGKQVADHYNKIAIELNKKWHSSVPKEYQLAFLPIDSKEGEAYIREMEYCVKFAFANRRLMMTRIAESFNKFGFDIYISNMINIAHNYARLENHFGKNVWVHRKGATSAKKDEIGIIPGSQGTKSYIVRGLGNLESFTSCSHGAGRRLGRKEASRTLSLKDEIRHMDERGIIHNIRNENDLDEAPSAYKDIDTVMENQQDLVETVVELKPLAVIKG